MNGEDKNNVGISLLKKGKKGISRLLFSRMGLIILLLLLQAAAFVALFYLFEEFVPHYYSVSAVFAIGMVLYILNTQMDPCAKLTWLVILIVTPIFGAVLYVFIQCDIGHRAMKDRLQDIYQSSRNLYSDDRKAYHALKEKNPGAASMTRYVRKVSGCPVFQNTRVTYFPLGEDKFKALLVELEKAEKFIYLEYFIVSEGLMWGKVLEILARKAKQGVDVRLMYDGTCEFVLLPKGYPQKLEELGIHCKVFAPVRPFLSTHYNYRDHRKILVIDGKTAFNGGINLADEYINVKDRFGHWKDTAVMLQGEAVASFTLMFLQMWNVSEKEPVYENITPCFQPEMQSDGFVMPYYDSPLDRERVGQQVYMDILARAQKYVHIMTPYLILDAEMENALKFAAARGVQVQLILPGVPDKKSAYSLAKTHYRSLMESGVEIYEYLPGFVHAKVFVCDDQEAVVGTINLDYRSLYHHFECATYMRDLPCIADIQKDFTETLSKCRRASEETLKAEKLSLKVMGFVLKAFAPLL